MAKRIAPSIFASTFFVAAASALLAQDASQANPYQGVSHPPADDQITTSVPADKPPAGTPMNAEPARPVAPETYVPPAAPPPGSQDPAQSQAQAPGQSQDQSQPSSIDSSVNFPPAPGDPAGGAASDGTDGGIVRVAQAAPESGDPGLNQRAYAYDPDGDIVHPRPLRPGELQEGTSIYVSLLDRLSTSEVERGQPFRTRVSRDVFEGGRVAIPAGAEIDGRVVAVSSGHAGASGALRLEPVAVILPNGARYHLHAEVTGTAGSRAHVVGEGTIKPDSRAKRDGIEYGGAVGSGAVVGAIVGGPVGALTGSLIGAGAITVHLLVSHSQVTLEPNTTLVFQLTDPLFLARERSSGE
jgi:type IV secretory pathway VirB10-like protein